jgi:RNA polymerase sigma-70 factor, ECF subfamily
VGPSYLYGQRLVRAMSQPATATDRDEAVRWAAALAGDRDAFAAVTGPYRRELQVHCYRMLGSLEDAEDVVQETLLRAWRRRETYRGRATVRAWLYGIATNACLDVLDVQTRRARLLPSAVGTPADPLVPPLPPAHEISWLEPYPDLLLDDVGVDDLVVARETIELAFLVTIQHLPARQRAVLILRDVLGWSARETAEVVGTTVVAANSALQRARATLKQHLPERRLDWTRDRTSDATQRRLLARYMDAWNRTDVDALVALLAHDARVAMPPSPSWYEGPAAIREFLLAGPMSAQAARHTHILTSANRQPAFVVYLVDETGRRMPQAHAVELLRIVDGLIAEIDVFLQPELVERFVAAAAL